MVNTTWNKRTLGEIGNFKKGKGICRADSNSGSYPAVRYGELYTTHNEYVKQYTSHVSLNVALQAEKATYGDILFAGSGETKEEIGKCAAIIDRQDVFVGGDVVIMTPKIKMHPVFMGTALNMNYIVKQRAEKAQGDAIVHISADALKETYLYYPDYEEQCKIAAIILEMDDLISNLERLIGKKKNIKQGVMQELLTGKKRLPGFTGEWATMIIGKCGYLQKGSIDPQLQPDDYFSEYSMPAFDTGKEPAKVQGKSMHSNRTVIRGRTLLFNKLNVRQRRIWLVEQCEDNAICSAEFLPYCSDKIDLQFLSQILYTDKVTDDFIGMSTGTSNSQKRITPRAFLDYSLWLPVDLEEQKALASVFRDMDLELCSLQNKLSKYRQLKQGMMQKLLTGEIRLV